MQCPTQLQLMYLLDLVNPPVPSCKTIGSGERHTARVSDVQPGRQKPGVCALLCLASTDYSKLLGFAPWEPCPVGAPWERCADEN